MASIAAALSKFVRHGRDLRDREDSYPLGLLYTQDRLSDNSSIGPTSSRAPLLGSQTSRRETTSFSRGPTRDTPFLVPRETLSLSSRSSSPDRVFPLRRVDSMSSLGNHSSISQLTPWTPRPGSPSVRSLSSNTLPFEHVPSIGRRSDTGLEGSSINKGLYALAGAHVASTAIKTAAAAGIAASNRQQPGSITSVAPLHVHSITGANFVGDSEFAQ